MDSIEEDFVKNFIRKDRQERILWELSNPKKRTSVIWRFSGPTLFESRCLRPIEYMPVDIMEKHLFRLSGAREVYFVGESYTGILPLKQAVTKAHTGEICVIYCGKGIGYY